MESWVMFKSFHHIIQITFEVYLYVLFILQVFCLEEQSCFSPPLQFSLREKKNPPLYEKFNSKTKIKIILHISVRSHCQSRAANSRKKVLMATQEQHKLKFKWQPSRKTFCMFKIHAIQTE